MSSRHTLEIQFTAPQASISMKIGLHRAYPFDVTATLKAYSGESAGDSGTFVAYTTAFLGRSASAITTPISITSPTANIRSLLLQFAGIDPAHRAIEVIDDLTFSTKGPACATDTTAPAVTISEPAVDDLLFYSPHVDLEFTASDQETGIAAIQVAFLDQVYNEVGSFYPCGGTGGPPCTHDASPLSSSANFMTWLVEGTKSIRIKAWDFASHSGDAVRAVNYTPPPATTNVWAMGMEITQATQSWVAKAPATRSQFESYIPVHSSSVPLVAGKRTSRGAI